MTHELYSSKSCYFFVTILLVLMSQVHTQADSHDWTDIISDISSTLKIAKKNIWN